MRVESFVSPGLSHAGPVLDVTNTPSPSPKTAEVKNELNMSYTTRRSTGGLRRVLK